MDTLQGFADLGQVVEGGGTESHENTSVGPPRLGDGKNSRYDENYEGNISTLAHLVDTDLTAAIRLILDRGWTATYEDLLSEHERRQKQAITELCGQHYQDFVSSVGSLVDVKYDIAKLKGHIRGYNELVQTSGSKVITAAKDLMPQRDIRNRIDQAVAVLQNCAERVDSLRIAQTQIVAKQYVQALSTLDRLDQVPHYSSRIADLIQICIKQFRAKVKACVRAEYDVWLQELPERSAKLGMIILAKAREHLHLNRTRFSEPANDTASADRRGDRELATTDRKSGKASSSSGSGGSGSGSVRRAVASVESSRREEEVRKEGGMLSGLMMDGLDEKEAQTLMEVQDSLGTVYQSLHINQLLDRQDFEGLKTYSKIRRDKHAKALVSSKPGNLNTTAGMFKNKEKYFGAILGFFAIQLAIVRSPLGGHLLSLEECHKLWVKVCVQLEGTVKLMFESLQSPMAWKELRQFTAIFVDALRTTGLPATPLKAFMSSKQADYQKLLERQLDKAIDQYLERDRFAPLQIQNKEAFRKHVSAFGLDDISRYTRFPATMGFSLSVPLICNDLAKLMEDYFSFKLAEHPDRGTSVSTGTTGNNASGDSSAAAGGGGSANGTKSVADVNEDPYIELMRLIDDILIKSLCERLKPDRLSARGSDGKVRARSAEDEGSAGYHGRGHHQRGNLPQSMVAQLLVNCSSFAGACDHFEERAYRMVEAAYPRRPPPASKALLRAKGELQGLEMQYNAILLEGLGARIDELLDLSSADAEWRTTKLNTEPWSSFEDLVALLQGAFASLYFLPAGLKEGAHLHAFNHISLAIRGYWRHELRCFTVVGLANFGISLKVIEDFARRCSAVPGVVEALEDLRQITDLILTEPRILAVADRKYLERKYRRVQPDLLCDVLGKFQTLGMFSRVPPGLPKHSKRDVEAAIKTLRSSGRIGM